jgi:hypothetical protein
MNTEINIRVVRFEVLRAVAMKTADFRDVTLCSFASMTAMEGTVPPKRVIMFHTTRRHIREDNNLQTSCYIRDSLACSHEEPGCMVLVD